MGLLLEEEGFQVRKYQVAQVAEARIDDGGVQDLGLHELELGVDGVEQDDDDPDHEGVHRQGEHQAERLVQPAEHGEFRHFREEFRHEDDHEADDDEDEGEGDDVERRLGNIYVGLQPRADECGEVKCRPDAQDDAREGQRLFEETL